MKNNNEIHQVMEKIRTRLIKTSLENIFSQNNGYAADESGDVTGMNLSGQRLKNVDFLKDFRTLQWLDLSNNMITDISVLTSLENLVKLDLSRNRVTGISCLRELRKLSWVNLKENKISRLPGDILEWGMEIKWESQQATGIILAGNPLEEPLKHAIESGRKAIVEYLDNHPGKVVKKEIPPFDTHNEARGKTIGCINQPVFNLGDSTGNIFVGGKLNVHNLGNPGVVNKEAGKNQGADQTKTILVLAANPRRTSKLRLDEEFREIEEGLRRAKQRDRFEIRSRWAVRLWDIRRALLDVEPHIVHFIGHGEEDGLKVEDELGLDITVSKEALAGLFEIFSDKIECVILSACYSVAQADTISKHIDYVIGMQKAINDKAAIEFSVGFYDALGAGESVEKAFKLGCNAIRMKFPDRLEHLVPVLKKGGQP